MNPPLPDSMQPLPEDVAGCHALIQRLRDELAETRRKLSVHVENERREMEWRYGKGVSARKLLSFGRLMAGKGIALAPGSSQDPACGELHLRETAARRKTRPRKK